MYGLDKFVLRMLIESSLFWKKYLPEYDVTCNYSNNIGTYFSADSVVCVIGYYIQ